MKRIALTDKRSIKEIIPKRGGEDVIIERRGRAVAVIVPLDQDDYQWYRRERDPAFIKSIAKARKQVREGKVMSLRQVKKKFGLK